MGGLNFDINSYLRLDVMDILMTCISTLIIVFIAKRFFWDKVTDYLNRRAAESAIRYADGKCQGGSS